MLIFKTEVKYCSTVVKPYLTAGQKHESKQNRQSNATPTLPDTHLPDSLLGAANTNIENCHLFGFSGTTEFNRLMERNYLH